MRTSKELWGAFLHELKIDLAKISENPLHVDLSDIPGVTSVAIDLAGTEKSFISYLMAKAEEEQNADPQNHTN